MRPTYQIRWFSPLMEIDFCGHASLASAFVLFSKNSELTQVNLSAKAVGIVPITKKQDDTIEMVFPNRMPKRVTDIPTQLIAGLSIEPKEVYRNQQAYIVVYSCEQEVLSVRRKNQVIKQLAPYDVVVTCQSEREEFDFISRYFWPANGGDEDPVTGSIHAGYNA